MLETTTEPLVATNSAEGAATGASPTGTGSNATSTTGANAQTIAPFTSTSSTSVSRLPGPSEYHVYDQYKSATTTQFVDVSVGTGASVAAGSVATVQYRGWLTSGVEFDESYARKQAFSFTEGAHRVIAGWEEGLYGMKVGGTRRLIIPASLGYGNQASGSIPANSMLIFDVELVSVH